MSRPELPVIAAIPAYNEAENIGGLLDQVLLQNYDSIYVLDDASTDSTPDVVKTYSGSVELVRCKENVGPAANRNRILGAIGHTCIIHFMDADVRLNSADLPGLAREVITPGRDIGYIGGLIRDTDGNQLAWNYGPQFSLPFIVNAFLRSKLSNLAQTDPARAATLSQKIAEHWTASNEWPNQQVVSPRRKIYWGAEPNTIIRSDIFRSIGGYDPRLRYHEAMDMARRMEEKGLDRYFDPSLDVTHLDGSPGHKSRTAEFWVDYLRVLKGVGLKKTLRATPVLERKPRSGTISNPKPL